MKTFEMDCYEIIESDGYTNSHVVFVSSLSLAQRIVDISKGYRSAKAYTKNIFIFDTMEEIEASTKENLIK